MEYFNGFFIFIGLYCLVGVMVILVFMLFFIYNIEVSLVGCY